eukprot:1767961-Rhodomonas_salina.1
MQESIWLVQIVQRLCFFAFDFALGTRGLGEACGAAKSNAILPPFEHGLYQRWSRSCGTELACLFGANVRLLRDPSEESDDFFS